MAILVIDYVFAICNVVRLDQVGYLEAPVLIKMRHDNGDPVFIRYLPLDSNKNVMAQNGLFVQQIDVAS